MTVKIDQQKESVHVCSGDSCQVRDALLIIGGKWKSMILYLLGNVEVVRFNKMKALIPDISQKMLTQQLRDLERDGLIKREAYPEIPPRVEYSITELGRSIGSLYKEIHLWQQRNYEDIIQCRKEYDKKLEHR